MNKKKLVALGILLITVNPCYSQMGQVISFFSSPGNNPTGLTWDGNCLWNADTQTNKIYKIDPETGNVVYSIPGPAGATINGLAWDGNSIWCSDNENDRLYQINPNDGYLSHVIYLQSANPRGIAYDGQHLWYQDSGDRYIFKIDPATDAYVDTLTSPGGYNRGLTWDGKYLWSTDRDKNEIYLIEPVTGTVIMILNAPGTYSYGLAFDGKFIWNADYETKTIYKISVSGAEKYQIIDPLKVRIRYSVTIKNVGSGAMNLKTYIAIPPATVYQSLDDSIQYNHPPQGYFYDVFDQRIAYYEADLAPGSEALYQWSQPTTLFNIRYFLHPDSVGKKEEIPKSIIDRYTANGEKYDITNPRITAAVREAVGDETNYYWQVRKLHDFVIRNIYYVNDEAWETAPGVLLQGHGSCSEYSFLFIALCRALGIPARYEAGGHLRDTIPYEDRVFHRWQQVYFPRYGWVPIDCTWDDREYPSNQARYFGAMSNQAFTTTIGGGGATGLWWSYNSANSSSGGIRSREKLMEWLPYSTYVEIVAESLTQNFKTSFNYPNPFNGWTTIQFYLQYPGAVKISIFNQLGQQVKKWNERDFLNGWHHIHWDGRNDLRNLVNSGIYFYRIEGKNFIQNGRMILLK